MASILGTRVDRTNGALDVTAIVGWDNAQEESGTYEIDFRVWEHDDRGDDDRVRVGDAIRINQAGRVVFMTLQFVGFPFFFRFGTLLMPTLVRFATGPGDWDTEVGDEEIYLILRLRDLDSGSTLDTVTTPMVTLDA